MTTTARRGLTRPTNEKSPGLLRGFELRPIRLLVAAAEDQQGCCSETRDDLHRFGLEPVGKPSLYLRLARNSVPSCQAINLINHPTWQIQVHPVFAVVAAN